MEAIKISLVEDTISHQQKLYPRRKNLFHKYRSTTVSFLNHERRNFFGSDMSFSWHNKINVKSDLRLATKRSQQLPPHWTNKKQPNKTGQDYVIEQGCFLSHSEKLQQHNNVKKNINSRNGVLVGTSYFISCASWIFSSYDPNWFNLPLRREDYTTTKVRSRTLGWGGYLLDYHQVWW